METNSVGEIVDSLWLWISLPRATFAVHLLNGIVNGAPPIGMWAMGLDGMEVIENILSIKNSFVIRMESDAEEKEN